MYHGNLPSQNFVSLKRQDVTGSGSASVTLDHSISSINDILVYVNEVKQNPNDMSVSGNSLTLGGTISASDSCYIIFLGQGLQTVTPADNTITTAMVQDNAITSSKLSAGAIVQVKQSVMDDDFSTSSSSFTDVTGLSVSITPTSSSSKVMVEFHIGTHDMASAGDFAYQIVRGTTAIGLGNGDGGTASTVGGTINADRGEGISMKFLDSPSTTSATTYKIQVRSPGSNTLHINTRDGNSNYHTISTITVMEILA
jgi:hypothetical protein